MIMSDEFPWKRVALVSLSADLVGFTERADSQHGLYRLAPSSGSTGEDGAMGAIASRKRARKIFLNV